MKVRFALYIAMASGGKEREERRKQNVFWGSYGLGIEVPYALDRLRNAAKKRVGRRGGGNILVYVRTCLTDM